jgi:hypothetical protein
MKKFEAQRACASQRRVGPLAGLPWNTTTSPTISEGTPTGFRIGWRRREVPQDIASASAHNGRLGRYRTPLGFDGNDTPGWLGICRDVACRDVARRDVACRDVARRDVARRDDACGWFNDQGRLAKARQPFAMMRKAVGLEEGRDSKNTTAPSGKGGLGHSGLGLTPLPGRSSLVT